MSSPDEAFARKIAMVLDRGVGDMESDTLRRLASARDRALDRYRERPEPVWSLAWAGNAQSRARRGAHGPQGLRYVIGALVLVIALAGVAFWQGTAPRSDVADIDADLLTGELPINAYLDKGFDTWLKRASR